MMKLFIISEFHLEILLLAKHLEFLFEGIEMNFLRFNFIFD